MSIATSFDFHRANAHISLDRHVKRRVVELGCALETRVAIYLDLNFWIRLKSCMLGLNGSGDDARLLRLLRSGAAEGRLFCPISESVFFEVLKQSDPSSRMATARLIDELSLGVTLLPNPRRFATEISHFFYSFQEDSELHPISHLVWSKIAYVLDFSHPSSTAFDTDTELVVQKSFFDHMCVRRQRF